MKGRARYVANLVLAFGVYTLGLVSVLACFDEFGWVPYLVAQFRVQLLALQFACVLGAALVRNRHLVITCLVVCIPNVLAIAPYFVERPAARDGSEPALRIAQLNVNCGNNDYEGAIAFIKKHDPDVILIQELTESWKRVIVSEFPEYRYGMTATRPDPFGVGVFSRIKTVEQKVRLFGGVPGAICTLDWEGTPVTVGDVHFYPPFSGALLLVLKAQLAQLVSESKTWKGEFIVAGDFNAVSWSSVYQKFTRDMGAHNASFGFGLKPTWPTSKYFRFPDGWSGLNALCLVPIDQCLLSDGLATRAMEVGSDIGSDHFPLYYEIVRRGGR